MMYLLVLLVIVALYVFVKVLMSALCRRYRRKVPSADALLSMGFFVDYLLDGRVEYILQGEEVALHEVFFLKRDIRTLLASGIQPNFRYIKNGKAVDHTTEEFKRAFAAHWVRFEEANAEYGGRLRRAHNFLTKAPYERLRKIFTFPA